MNTTSSSGIERPGLPTRLAVAGLAYLGTVLLAVVSSPQVASTDIRSAGYFPR